MEGVNWIHLAKVKDVWNAFVNTVMNHDITRKTGYVSIN
jgi:hypothetical protein